MPAALPPSSWLCTSILLVVLGAAGCSRSGSGGFVGEGAPCAGLDRCEVGLVCLLGTCKRSCNIDADCNADAICNNGICVPRTCGDGVLGPEEACDDTGLADGDGCDAACRIEPGYTCVGAPSVCTPVCGDGAAWGSEACDDGGAEAGDGCSGDCAVEVGWSCAGAPSVCTTSCGDGVIAGVEGCEDGGRVAGDGCSAGCLVEIGWACAGRPSVCAPVCGDALIIAGEECDDGGLAGADGCSAACLVEPGWHCSASPSTCEQSSPSIEDSCSATASEDTAYGCQLGAADPDRAEVHVWSLGAAHTCAWLVIDPQTGAVSGTPRDDDVGSCVLDVEVSDGATSPGTAAWTVSVANVQPALSVADPAPLAEDAGISVIASDADVQASDEGAGTYALVTPSGDDCREIGDAAIDPSTGAISFTPDADWAGACRLAVSFDDGNGPNGVVIDELLVSVGAENDAPLIIAVPDTVIMTAGTTVSGLQVEAKAGGGADEAAQVLSFSTCQSDLEALSVTCGSFVAGAASLSLTASSLLDATVLITVVVDDDAQGRSVASSFQVQVTSTPPVLSVSDAVARYVDQTAVVTVTASRADARAMSAAFGTSNDTATAGVHYTATSGRVDLAPGATTAQIVVPLSGAMSYANTSFLVTLSSATGASLGTVQARVTLTSGTVSLTGGSHPHALPGADVNGDGFGDIALQDGSATVVVLGAPAPPLSVSASDAGVVLSGYSGAITAARLLPDTDGDGSAEIGTTVFLTNPTSGAAADAQHVIVRGSATLGDGSVADLRTAGQAFAITAVPGNYNRDVLTGGDIDGDGDVDLLVGASGYNYSSGEGGRGAFGTFFNAGTGWGADFAYSTASVMVSPAYGWPETPQRWGYEGSGGNSLGDFDDDGKLDFVVYKDTYPSEYAEVRVYYGGPTSGTLNQDGGTIVAADMVGGGAWGGHGSDSAACDVNGDGVDDAVMSPMLQNAPRNGVTVRFGTAAQRWGSLNNDALTGANGFYVRDDVSAYSGATFECADLDADGLDDVVLTQANGSSPPPVKILWGRDSGFSASYVLSTLGGNDALVLTGTNGWYGPSLTDFDGDGRLDIVVTGAGATQVIPGRNWRQAAQQQGTDAADVLIGSAAPDVLIGGRGDDVLRGLGGADVLMGGHGADVLVIADASFRRVDGGAGTDTLELGAAGVLDLRLVDDHRYRSVEHIALVGSGAQVVRLDRATVLALSDDTNVVRVSGDAEDCVTLEGAWTDGGTAGGYREWVSGAARARVQLGVGTTCP